MEPGLPILPALLVLAILDGDGYIGYSVITQHKDIENFLTDGHD